MTTVYALANHSTECGQSDLTAVLYSGDAVNMAPPCC